MTKPYSNRENSVFYSLHLDVFSIAIESLTTNDLDPENIEIYYINLDVFSIGNQCFAVNELGFGLWMSIMREGF